jgi:predicted TIM-barrel fold metal-dependent hydrolase
VLPSWDLDAAINAADTLKVRVQVVSVTAPGPAIAGPTEEGRQLARACNDEVAQLASKRPSRFAFFGSLPDWNDVEGTLAEIDYIFGTLKAPGVIAMTTYGPSLLGDAKFKPIWEKLDSYAAIVFIHPGAVNIVPKLVAGSLPQPIVDYPQATTRTAADLVLTRTLTENSKFKVILSHAGGTLPWLSDRIGVGSMAAGANQMAPAKM